jgi:hypothetical protein
MEGERGSTGDGQRRVEQSTEQNRAQPERELVQLEAGGSRLDIGERGKGRVAGATRGRDTLTGWAGWTAASKGPRAPKACQGRVNRYLPQPMPVH